jgi:hypothetical protein
MYLVIILFQCTVHSYIYIAISLSKGTLRVSLCAHFLRKINYNSARYEGRAIKWFR